MRDIDDGALELRLREVLKERLGPLPLDLTMETLERRREATGKNRRFGRGRGMTLLAAAAAVVLVGGALAAGSGILRRPAVVPPAPSRGPLAIASADATSPTSPSHLASTSPSPSVVLVPWTAASIQQDWPAPVRTEPVGGASVAPMPPTYIDPSRDDGSDATPYVDIRDVTAGTKALSFDLMSRPPNVDPSQAWIAYGVVVDVNRDGVPDWRYGIDNLPRAAAEDQTQHRAWRTNLHTGLTEFSSNARGGDEMDQVGNTHFGSSYPATEAGASFLFYETGDLTGGGEFKLGAKQDKPFYVWASAIVDGRVVATDYAPDTGWLDPTLGGANPGGTYLVPKLTNAPSPFRLTLTVPQGWMAAGPFLSPSQDNGLGLQFLIADHPAEWSCDASGRALKPPVGPSVDDLVTFLESQQPQGMIRISSTTDVTLDGYRGTYLEYTTSYDGNTNCQPPEWPFENLDRTGFHQVWVLDVEGVRLVIDASASRTSDAVKAQFGQIVDSIAIEPSTTLEPIPSPTPTPTPTAVPTPTPTPFPPAVGPIPQGARSWEVSVENKSSKAATLFLAREPLNDMGDLCGAVTPDVVPARTTEKVTFQLPGQSVNDCWLMVRPGPGASGGHGPTNEWPIPGKLVIQDGGDNANGDDLSAVWQGP